MLLLFISIPFLLYQSPGDVRGQEERVHGRAAEERRRNEANVRPKSQREGGRAQGSRERGTVIYLVSYTILEYHLH